MWGEVLKDTRGAIRYAVTTLLRLFTPIPVRSPFPPEDVEVHMDS